jgi:hypothetical protein
MTTIPPRVTFRVPNDDDGNTFIKLARKYVNRERYGSILTRPRGGTRGKYAFSSQRFDAKAFGVYLQPREEVKAAEEKSRQRHSILTYDHNLEIDQIRIAHTEKCVTLRCRISDLQKLREQHGVERAELRSHVAELQKLRNEGWAQCSKLKAERDAANDFITHLQLKLANYKHAAWTFIFISAVLTGVLL